jgi:type III pantothenate kinase
LVVASVGNIEKSLLEFEKEVHFVSMMTIFLSSIGMKHHKHWELIGWFCCWRNLAVSGLNRLVIDAGTCVTFDFIDESDNTLRRNRPGLQLRYKSLHDFTAAIVILESPKGVVGTQPENQFILEL